MNQKTSLPKVRTDKKGGSATIPISLHECIDRISSIPMIHPLIGLFEFLYPLKGKW
ncbi:hypothetical protein ACJROX_13835 [Pseudalkalibacillus sp. A8]|uniref:hypothetical protein n=1 Tax=Pseudalkalibacillus sp. A8 TaxID=3382641 RepID=UPI0038B58964